MKKNILLGICSSIASYKSCELIRMLIKDGFSIKVIMTPNATKFISPLVFEELSDNPVYVDTFERKEKVEHISLCEWAHFFVICPLSANTLSKIATGICDNLLTTVACAFSSSKKILLVPAMNENMWKNPIIQENVKKLKKYKKYIIMNPEKGELLCKDVGVGRLPSLKKIYHKIKSLI
jgi:phosphopantothenoylcysteine decarboxylase/phosphopantothenate--cysteine ligase